MRIEIKCAHPIAKREQYASGFVCGVCGSVGGHSSDPVGTKIAYFDIPDEMILHVTDSK